MRNFRYIQFFLLVLTLLYLKSQCPRDSLHLFFPPRNEIFGFRRTPAHFSTSQFIIFPQNYFHNMVVIFGPPRFPSTSALSPVFGFESKEGVSSFFMFSVLTFRVLRATSLPKKKKKRRGKLRLYV